MRTLLDEKTLKKLAKKLKKETGRKHSQCLNDIVKGLGFRNYHHYRKELMKGVKNEF